MNTKSGKGKKSFVDFYRLCQGKETGEPEEDEGVYEYYYDQDYY